MRPFLPFACLAVATVVTAPFLGLVRDALFERFGSTAVYSLMAVLATAALALGITALARVFGDQDRRRRNQRLWLLSLVAFLLFLQVVGLDTGIPTVDVAEKIHIFQYGAMAFLLYRALRSDSAPGPDSAPAKPSRSPAVSLDLLLFPVLGGALIGLLDESVQGYFQLRTADVRDVVLDTAAALVGLIFAIAVQTPGAPDRRKGWHLDKTDEGDSRKGWHLDKSDAGVRDDPRSGSWRKGWHLSTTVVGQRRLGRILALTTVIFGLFFARFHLGHEIHDPSIGRFVSLHSADELRELSLRRSQTWAIDPPTGLVAWYPEDYYLTEAAWHANHRNERHRAGDAWMALQANRILEEWYDPFLDLESFRGSGRHRWPPGIVAQLEAQLSAPTSQEPSGIQPGSSLGPIGAAQALPGSGEYFSPVLRKRVYTFARDRDFLLAIAMTALALLIPFEVSARRKAAASHADRDVPS